MFKTRQRAPSGLGESASIIPRERGMQPQLPARANASTPLRDDPQSLLNSLGGGASLDAAVRSRMEGGLGVSLGDVRVHVDGHAAALASQLEARAFTVGRHVAFGAGQYRPNTVFGDALLAHEFAHSAQQRDGVSSGGHAAALEHDADRAAMHTLVGGRATPRLGATGLRLQRCSRSTSQPAEALLARAQAAWGRGDRAALFRVLRAVPRGPGRPDPSQDAALNQWLDRTLGAVPFDRAYAGLLLRHGPETSWPAGAEMVIGRSTERPDTPPAVIPRPVLNELARLHAPTAAIPAVPSMLIRAYFFQGLTNRRALVIGGVHASEPSGTDVVERLRAMLTAPRARRPYFTTILVPVLFPSNAEFNTRYRNMRRGDSGVDPPDYQIHNEVSGRYSIAPLNGSYTLVEPNRNLPMPGESLATALGRGPGRQLLWRGDRATPLGDLRRTQSGVRHAERVSSDILGENVALLQLIEHFQPERIASVHAHSASEEMGNAPGIFVDPRQAPAERDADDRLATRMVNRALGLDLTARELADDQGFERHLNPLQNNPGFVDRSAIPAIPARPGRPGRPAIPARAATPQAAIHYAAENTPPGTSLGDWAPVAVNEGENRPGNRQAITTITVEFRGYTQLSRARDEAESQRILNSVRIHAQVLRDVFLGPDPTPAPARRAPAPRNRR